MSDQYSSKASTSKNIFRVNVDGIASGKVPDSSGRLSPKMISENQAKYLNSSVHRCLLLEDLTADKVPLQFQQILNHFDPSTLSQSELLFLLVYMVALEIGYVAEADAAMVGISIEKVPSWSPFHARNIEHLSKQKPSHTSDVNKTCFKLKLRNITEVFEDNPDDMSVMLTSLVSGDYMIITLSPESTLNKGYSTCLPINRYVLNSHAIGKPVQNRLLNIRELANIVREELFVPMRISQMDSHEITLYPGLPGLPPELVENVFAFLPRNQIKKMANVNRTLNSLATKSLAKREWTPLVREN